MPFKRPIYDIQADEDDNLYMLKYNIKYELVNN